MKTTNIKKIFFSIIFCGLLSAAFFFNILKANAQEQQGDSLSDLISQTKDEVTQLLNLKDNTTLPSDQKQQQETDLNIKIISNVLNISLSQVSSTIGQFSSTTAPQGEDWTGVYAYVNNLLNNDYQYYQTAQDEFSASSTVMTLDQLKSFAKDLNDKKTNQTDEDLQRINIIIAALNTPDILSIADDRLVKVSSDVKKIYDRNMTKNQTLKDLYNQASKYLSDAHDYNNQALDMILNTFTASSTTSTKDYVASLKDKISKSKEVAANALSDITSPDSTSSSTQNLSATPRDIDNYLANLVSNAYTNIKSAYDVFVKMSTNINKYLND